MLSISFSQRLVPVPSSVTLPERNSMRIRWIDALRGVAILAVVVGHINLGIMQAGLTQEAPQAYKELNSGLYSVHMPLFALLFGLNIPGAWQRRGSVTYALNRVNGFIYLYLIWSLIQGTAEVMGARFSNGGTTWAQVANIFQPLAHLWYLPWMVAIFSFLILVRPWEGALRALFSSVLFLGCAGAFWGVNYPFIFGGGIAIYLFALVGAMIGTERVGALNRLPAVVAVPLVTVFWGAFGFLIFSDVSLTTPTLLDPYRTVSSVLCGMVATVTGVLGVTLLVACLSRWVSFKVLAFLGRYSLHIYLMHLLVTPLTRILLASNGINNPIVIMIISTITGVGLPVCGALIFEKRLPWLFNAPSILLIPEKVKK